MCVSLIRSTRTAEKGSWGPHWASGRERRVIPALSRAWHTGAFHTHVQKYAFICSQLSGRSLLCCWPHLRVCICTHKWPWCSLNRSYVLHCDAWAYCLELLWQKDWNHSLGSAVATSQWLAHRNGASMKTVQANFSSRYWSPAHLDSWQIWFILLPVFWCWREVSPWLTLCQY